MKKTERQNGIIHLLRMRRKMTAKELADYFDVSERTVYRDIDALSQLHVPIISYEGLGGGYEIDSSYFLPSIKLSEQEILMLERNLIPLFTGSSKMMSTSNMQRYNP